VIRDADGVNLSLHDGVLLCAARAIAELRQEGFFAAGNGRGGRLRSPTAQVEPSSGSRLAAPTRSRALSPCIDGSAGLGSRMPGVAKRKHPVRADGRSRSRSH
jgi:hypothetical protein